MSYNNLSFINAVMFFIAIVSAHFRFNGIRPILILGFVALCILELIFILNKKNAKNKSLSIRISILLAFNIIFLAINAGL